MHDSTLQDASINNRSLKESSVDTIKERQNMNLGSIGNNKNIEYALPPFAGKTINSKNAHLLKNQHYFNVKTNENGGRNFMKEGTSTGI